MSSSSRCWFRCLVAAVVAATTLLAAVPARAAFAGRDVNAANSWTADLLDPVTNLQASRPCVRAAAVAPTAAGVSTAYTTGAATSLSVAAPTGSPGDLWVAGVAVSTDAAVSTPPGWTLLQSGASGTTSRLAVFTMSRPASPSPSYTFTWSSAASAVLAIADYTGALSVQSSASQPNASSTSVTLPSLNAATAPTSLLLLAAVPSANTLAVTAPSGTTSRLGSVYGLPDYPRLLLWDQALGAAGATGTRTAAMTSARATVGATLLLSAAPGAPDPTVHLTWTPSTDLYADGYQIARSDGTVATVTGRGTSGWDDTSAEASGSYGYVVQTSYGSWRSSGASTGATSC